MMKSFFRSMRSVWPDFAVGLMIMNVLMLACMAFIVKVAVANDYYLAQVLLVILAVYTVVNAMLLFIVLPILSWLQLKTDTPIK